MVNANQKEMWRMFQLDIPLIKETPKKERKKHLKKSNEAVNHIVVWLKKHWYLSLVLLFMLLFGKTIISSALILIMLALAVVISLHKMVMPVNIGLELVSFFTITISVAISPLFGLVFATTAILISQIIHGRSGTFIFIKIPVYITLCFIAAAFEPIQILRAGVITVLVGNVIFIASTLIFNSEKIWSNVPAAAINIAMNCWLFLKFGEGLVNILVF